MCSFSMTLFSTWDWIIQHFQINSIAYVLLCFQEFADTLDNGIRHRWAQVR